jgi:L-lysine exporter family protein LysE/ArgO
MLEGMPILLLGLATGLSLIVAIGPQNALILRQGIRRESVAVVLAICIASDLVLIAVGAAGVGGLVTAHPGVLQVFRWGGAAYLLWFAFTSFRAAWSSTGLTTAAAPQTAQRSVATTTLALTWLNPHVYLDTVVLMGSLANQHGPVGRWWFALGAVVASVMWFLGLGLGSRGLARPLSRPGTWRFVDGVIGLFMLVVAWRLATG